MQPELQDRQQNGLKQSEIIEKKEKETKGSKKEKEKLKEKRVKSQRYVEIIMRTNSWSRKC